MSTTIQNYLARHAEDIAKKARSEEMRLGILAELPASLPQPTISNESTRAFFGQPGAWVSFSSHYERDYPKGSEILAAIEAAGFVPMAVTLCKWGDYRRTPEPGLQSGIPEVKTWGTRMEYKLTDSEAVAPLWLNPNPFTGTEAHAYYRAPSGMVLKVRVQGPARCNIQARRKEYVGGWYYERGSARLAFPDSWHSVEHEGQPVLNVAKNSGAQVDTEQGISGQLYFTPIAHEQAEFPMSPAMLLAALEVLV